MDNASQPPPLETLDPHNPLHLQWVREAMEELGFLHLPRPEDRRALERLVQEERFRREADAHYREHGGDC